MTISLCMICGNEEAVILDCLESARGAFDELCLVRAIGSLTPDRTEQLAEEWCAKNGRRFLFRDYHNQVDLPHVDHFGNARNLSFKLATRDWCLWLDCDDQLNTETSLQIVDAVQTTGLKYNSVHCTYRLVTGGGDIQRERLIRNGQGCWSGAIHETCLVEGEVLRRPDIVILHRDHKHKDNESSKRNVVLLEKTVESAHRHFFYLAIDLKNLGRKEEAERAARAALALLPQSFIEERYLTLLNLGQLSPEDADRNYMEAIRIQPHRREAYAHACQRAMGLGLLSDAVAWFKCMDAMPLPEPLPWTHQVMWHGWGRNLLRVRLLRALGRNEDADAEHARYMLDSEYAEGIDQWDKHPS